jgi:hypothetical protein
MAAVGVPDGPLASLTLSTSSSNVSLVPTANVVLGRTGRWFARRAYPQGAPRPVQLDRRIALRYVGSSDHTFYG